MFLNRKSKDTGIFPIRILRYVFRFFFQYFLCFSFIEEFPLNSFLKTFLWHFSSTQKQEKNPANIFSFALLVDWPHSNKILEMTFWIISIFDWQWKQSLKLLFQSLQQLFLFNNLKLFPPSSYCRVNYYQIFLKYNWN